MISVEAALQTILEHIPVLGTERVQLGEAPGRVLAEDIVAPCSIPPDDNSAMDGYAVRAADISTATVDTPVRLTVTADLPAGHCAAGPLAPGTAIRIMTGAPIPAEADTVVRQEDARAEGAEVLILLDPGRGAHVRRAGEDLCRGQLLFPAGTPIRAAHAGILASIRRSSLSVYQQPRVAILSTGDELVDIDEAPGPGKIVGSNAYSLAALVRENGGTPLCLGIARDCRGDLTRRFRDGLHADVLISTGGVSVGDYDFVKDVLQDLGLAMKFWKVAMRPGQPLAFGTIEGRPVFGLPGNPVSAMVSFEQFVRPALRKMCGHTRLFRPTVAAVAEEPITVTAGKKYFIRCRLTLRDGQYFAASTGAQGSGILMSMAAANGLMIVPEEQETVRAGQTVLVQILDNELGFTETPVY